ncbi:transporter substrate-binding domain-containing protein [Pseudoalteromonas sp. SIMBA_162]|uniref:transporter substrate-binding domain-containing protein n=1 Tax=Pseudoalteromonas sp. SIMBA_162 TaxID=3080867 RepID=UPI00397E285E
MHRLKKYGLYLLVALSFGSGACEKRFFVASHDTYWPPYVVNVDGHAQGKEVTALWLIFAGSPYCVQVEFLPNTERAFVEQTKGRMDLGWAASFTEKRAEHVYFSDSYRNEVMWLYQHKNKQYNVKNLQDALEQGYTVAAHVGSYYGEQFEHLKNIYPKQIIFTGAAKTRFALLAKQRIDFIIEDQLVGEYFVSQSNNIKQVNTTTYVNKGSIHLMLSKNTSTMQDVIEVNKLIQSRKAQLAELFEKL